VAFPVDWWEIIFNPSMPYRLAHMMVASGLTAAFMMAGLSAYRLLKGDHKPAPRLTLKTAVFAAALLIPLQIALGDFHGLNTLKHQPAKVAAMEGLWETTEGAPLVLFGLPDEQQQRNHYALEIPGGASFILTHDWQGEVKGLNEFVGEHPPVAPVFWGFRIMVGLGFLMLAVAWVSSGFLWRRGALPNWLLKVLVGMTFSGWVATLAGWYVTEIGRQPYLVTGVLTTADAVTQVPSGNVATSLAIYLTLYGVLFVAYISTLFLIARKAVQVDRDEEVSTLQDRYNPMMTSTGDA